MGNIKIFNFDQHGLNDYIFSLSAMTLPSVLKLGAKSINRYAILGFNLTAYNLLSDHRYALKGLISKQKHKQIDILNVALLTSLTLLPSIRKNKKTLLFHLGYTALAALHVQLSKWKKENEEIIHLFI